MSSLKVLLNLGSASAVTEISWSARRREKERERMERAAPLLVFADWLCWGTSSLPSQAASSALGFTCCANQPEVKDQCLLRSFLRMHSALDVHRALSISQETWVFLNAQITWWNSLSASPFRLLAPYCMPQWYSPVPACCQEFICLTVFLRSAFWSPTLRKFQVRWNRDEPPWASLPATSGQVRADKHNSLWITSAQLLLEPGTRVLHWEHGLNL